MIKIFTTGAVKTLDRYTIENEPVRSADLVERAAQAFVQEFLKRYSKQYNVIVFAGFGNNGADALAVARLLLEESYKVETFLFTGKKLLSADCSENKMRLLRMDRVEFTEVVSDFKAPELTRHTIVIDGLFGSGLNRPLEGGFAAVVEYINDSEATVVSIDMPSGLFGEDNSTNHPEAIIRADLTLTFTFPKLAFFLAENEAYVGEWKRLDIGISTEVIEKTETPYALAEEEDIHASLRCRGKFTHKGTYGHALLIAGSKGKMGASLLAARGVLRSGAGLLTVHVPRCGEQLFQTAFPEAMISLDLHKDYFTWLPEIKTYAAIGIGSGLGQQPESKEALAVLLQTAESSLVIDADAINIIAADADLLALVPPQSILTPHPKEFDRLAGTSETTYERLQKARSFAKEHQFYLILKGAYTAVCTPAGNVYFNPTGNPGMATAGSGDVLTGVILGLLAQGYDPGTASVVAVFIHGSAGDLAAHYQSEESMIASDIIEMLGRAFKQVE